MNLTLAQAGSLARELKRRVAALYAGPEAVVCPSFLHIPEVRQILEGSVIAVGSQDVAPQEPGAVTGGVSAEQLRELQLRFTLVGHSERRLYFGETDDMVSAKIRATFRVGLTPVMCFGETLEERESGRTEDVVVRQVLRGLEELEPQQIAAVVLAYEPVWAIGTGRNAEPSDVNEVHRLIRGLVRERAGVDAAEGVRILYGGSVKPSNIASYMESDDVDGALVGGASLDPEDFVRILRYQNGDTEPGPV